MRKGSSMATGHNEGGMGSMAVWTSSSDVNVDDGCCGGGFDFLREISDSPLKFATFAGAIKGWERGNEHGE